jgi:signal transduction histidine kinase
LLNAQQALEGNGRIRIATETSSENVLISIEDNGKGIPAQDLQHIFDPGFTTKGVRVGTGLGLPICFQIVEQHGGSIDVESTLGEGTTVTVTLPLSRPKQSLSEESR